MENSSSLEASDGVLKSDCNNILPDLNATLLDASVDSPPPQKRTHLDAKPTRISGPEVISTKKKDSYRRQGKGQNLFNSLPC